MPPTLTTKSSVADAPHFSIITKALAGGQDQTGRRRFNAVASSTIVDRQGDEISLKALQQMALKFREGVTIFTDHKNEVFNAFGTTDSAEIVEGGLDPKTGARIWDLKIAGVVNEPNLNAIQLHESITGGYVKLGCSIDAFVTDHKPKQAGRYDIDGLDVFAASIVGVPANQRSWAQKAVRAIKSFYGEPEEDDMPPALIETENTTGTTHEGTEVALGDVVELSVDAAGNGTSKVIAKAGSPEAEEFHATYGDSENPVELDTAAEIAELEAELAVEKSPLSSEARGDLPDSAFACPEQRKYPIRNADGKLDANHVRNALARVSDTSNDQCGRGKIIAAARELGIGDHEGKSLDELEAITKADGCPDCGKGHDDGGDCSNSYHSTAKAVDGEGGQESTQETPETAPIVTVEAEPLDEKAAGVPTEGVQELLGHVKRLVKEIEGLRAENQRLVAENQRLTKSNESVYGEVALAKQVINRVMETPLRSQTAAYVSDFAEGSAVFRDLYPEIAKYLSTRGE